MLGHFSMFFTQKRKRRIFCNGYFATFHYWGNTRPLSWSSWYPLIKPTVDLCYNAAGVTVHVCKHKQKLSACVGSNIPRPCFLIEQNVK